MTTFIYNLIKSADIFGVAIELEFEKKNKFKTILGGIISFALYATTISLIYTLGRSLARKDSPKTNKSILNLPYAPLMDIATFDLRFAMGFYTKEM